MAYVIESLSEAARRHAAYMRTKRELEAMPLDVALDLDIYRGDAARLAREAVYG